MPELEWIYGRQVVRLALAPGARRRPLRCVGTFRALADLRLPPRLQQEVLETGEIAQLTGSREHQGVALAVPPYPYADPKEVLGGDLIVVLDEVSDPRNLGAVARSALATGASGLVVPRHRSASVTPAAVKASAGATEHLPVAQVTNIVAFLRDAEKAGFWVYGAVAGAPRSYLTLDFTVKVVLVLGSEDRGLRRLVADTCDELAALPVQGPGQSLNVSVAAAVLLYEARRQRDAKALTLPATAETKPAAGRNRRGGEAGERQ